MRRLTMPIVAFLFLGILWGLILRDRVAREKGLSESAPTAAGFPADLADSMSSSRGAGESGGGILETARLQLRDADTGQPVADAELRWIREGEHKPKQAWSDAAGFCELGAPGCYALEARSPEHLPLLTVLELGAEVTDLHLFRCGALRLVFQDERGLPEEGVEVSLEQMQAAAPLRSALEAHPDFAGPGAADHFPWKELAQILSGDGRPHPARLRVLLYAVGGGLPAAAREGGWTPSGAGEMLRSGKRWSGPDGVVEWPELPVSGGWRWRLHSEHAVAWNPPQERRVTRFPSGRTQEERPEPGCSGSFAVAAGTEILVTVYRCSGVRGRLVSPNGRRFEAGWIEVYDRKEYDAYGGGKYRANEGDLSVPVSPSGEFELVGLRPGTKKLAAWWREGERELYFVQRYFELNAAELLDLGELRPPGAHRAVIRLSVEDLQGRLLNPGEVWENPPLVELMVDNLARKNDPVAAEEDLWDRAPCALGSTWEFGGLPAGKWRIDGYMTMDAAVLKPPYLAPLRSSGQVEFEFPGPDPLEAELRWRVPRSEPYSLVLEAPHPLPPGRLSIWALSHAGPVASLRMAYAVTGRTAPELPFEFRFTFLEGPSRVLAMYQTAEGSGWSAFGLLEPDAGGAPPRFMLTPGVRLRGRIEKMGISPDFPRPEMRALNFSLLSVAGESVPEHEQLGGGFTDAQGFFELNGFPPHALLRHHGFTDATFATGEPGGVLDLLLDPLPEEERR